MQKLAPLLSREVGTYHEEKKEEKEEVPFWLKPKEGEDEGKDEETATLRSVNEKMAAQYLLNNSHVQLAQYQKEGKWVNELDAQAQEKWIKKHKTFEQMGIDSSDALALGLDPSKSIEGSSAQ